MSRRLQENMELLACKRQKDYERVEGWKDKIRYYEDWNRHNSQYQNWTSNEYYETSLVQFEADKKAKERKENVEHRRDKLRKLLFDEDRAYEMEISESPRGRRSALNKPNEVPYGVLKEVNIGLKLADEDRRRNEAELKLYHKWRNENPIVRDFESNQNRGGLKLAWLDQQIEKRMEREKSETETKKMIEERNRLIKEEERLEQIEQEERSRSEKKLMQDIEQQMQRYKINESEADRLRREEETAIRKKYELEEILERRQSDIRKRQEFDCSLYNINQCKMKLRKKAIAVEEQLMEEGKVIEEIEKMKAVDAITNEEKKAATKSAVLSYLKYVQEQKQLERQRQQYISFIFDSEAKAMWHKQERMWKEEQEARDGLLEDVLQGLRQQMDEHIRETASRRMAAEGERQETLEALAEADRRVKRDREDAARKKTERKIELDRQVDDERLVERERVMVERAKREEELEVIRKEEERLRNEIMQLQRGKYHPARFSRKNFW